ncbi:MAG: translation initiation factor [Bacteroidetes bacterium]|nr:translation initiation factor [Bacteroidota bacterium]MBS1628569.1 translation initiation factor [Bacteroidota bacterium]
MAKNRQGQGGFVYSTNPDFKPIDEEQESPIESLPKAAQKLRVVLDKKQRAGKVVTLVTGFVGKPEDLQALGKDLKTKCGSGGSVKEAEILIQGDYREKIIGWLKAWGYSNVK